MLAWFNHQFLPDSNLTIPVQDLSVLRGYAIFDFFRTSNFKPLFRDFHLDRFYRSAEALRLLPVPPPADIIRITDELINRNQLAESGIRLLLTGGQAADGYTMTAPALVITQHPLQMPDQPTHEKGIRIITQEYTRPFPAIKTTNYIMGILLQEKVRQAGASDVLFHQANRISEFPRCNVFIVTADNKVTTPSRDILHGITRMQVIKLATELFELQERDISLEEVYTAKEVFLTATSKRIMPVTHINGTAIGNGKPGIITMQLLARFMEIENKIAGLI